MNGLPYYKAYPRDFLEGTIGMPFELKAAYRLVLDLIYMTGGRLPDDPQYIAGHLGCSVRKWNSMRAQLIERGKIRAERGIISNFRADKQLESTRKYQETQSENRRGWRKNKGLQERPSNHTESESESPPKSPPRGDCDADLFEAEKKATSKAARGSRLPGGEGWTLPDHLRAWAVSRGLSDFEVRREAEKFRDYWIAVPGAKGRKVNWDATWRSWIRRALEDRSKRAPPGGGSASQRKRNYGL